MNFLAHIYLSGNNLELTMGNFIADHIKGKAVFELPEGIRNGVFLHRKIDHFTDSHPVVLQSKERLRPVFRKYAPVVADVFYDHFLAANWNRYSDSLLSEFASNFYQAISDNMHLLPAKTKIMLPYMITNNWLVSYATIEGINNVMNGMSRRAAFDSHMELAAKELELNYNSYEKEFTTFFTELQYFTKKEISDIKISL